MADSWPAESRPNGADWYSMLHQDSSQHYAHHLSTSGRPVLWADHSRGKRTIHSAWLMHVTQSDDIPSLPLT